VKTMSYTESHARYAEVLDVVTNDREEAVITLAGHESGVRRTTWLRPTEVLLVWDENAWDDYLWWQPQERQVLTRVDTLLQDIAHPCERTRADDRGLVRRNMPTIGIPC